MGVPAERRIKALVSGRGGVGTGASLSGVADAVETAYEIRLVPYRGRE